MEKGHRWWFVIVSDEERASFSLSLSLSMERDLSLLTYLEQARPGGHGDPACGRSGASESDARELLQKTKNEKSEKKTDAHTQKNSKKERCLSRALRRAARQLRAPRSPAAVSRRRLRIPWQRSSRSVRVLGRRGRGRRRRGKEEEESYRLDAESVFVFVAAARPRPSAPSPPPSLPSQSLTPT